MVYYTKCLKCLPTSLTHARSLFVKLSTALLFEFCGNSSQIDCRASFSSSMLQLWLKRVVALQQYLSKHSNPVDSGPEKFGGHSYLSMNPLLLVAIQSCATCAACTGAPSCWKMKPAGRRVLQCAISSVAKYQRKV